MLVLKNTTNWFDFKWTEFLSMKPWTVLSDSLQTYLLSLSFVEMHSIALSKGSHDKLHPDLSSVLQCRNNLDDMMADASSVEDRSLTSLWKHMSPKKHHEVLRFTNFLGDCFQGLGSAVVVDIGSGLGYLPQTIHRHYSVPVLCVESSTQLCATADLLSAESAADVTTVCHSLSGDDLATCERAIINKLDSEGKRSASLLLTGLHCCGDLTPAALQLFLSSTSFVGITVVSCCYHKMTLKADSGYANFPMSSAVRTMLSDAGLCLSSFALRLAAQESCTSWAKWSASDHAHHRQRVAFRSLLDAHLRRSATSHQVAPRVVRKASKAADLEGYFRACGLACDDAEVCALQEEHRVGCAFVEPFLFLQMLVQPLLEALLLLDRAAFLRENGAREVQLVRLFDSSVSPRCVAIVAKK